MQEEIKFLNPSLEVIDLSLISKIKKFMLA